MPPGAAALQPAHRGADHRPVEVGGHRAAAFIGLRIEVAGVVRLVPDRPDVDAREAARRRLGEAAELARARARFTPARSPRARRGPAGRGRREREHHLEAARLGVREQLRRSAPSRGTAPGPWRRSRAACVLPPGATAAQFSCTLIMSTPRPRTSSSVALRWASPLSASSLSSWNSANWRTLAPAAAGSSARATSKAIVSVVTRIRSGREPGSALQHAAGAGLRSLPLLASAARLPKP